MTTEGHALHHAEHTLLAELRLARRKMRASGLLGGGKAELTVGQRVADSVASGMGSWRFIIIQSGILVIWIILNITAWVQRWDPYRSFF